MLLLSIILYASPPHAHTPHRLFEKTSSEMTKEEYVQRSLFSLFRLFGACCLTTMNALLRITTKTQIHCQCIIKQYVFLSACLSAYRCFCVCVDVEFVFLMCNKAFIVTRQLAINKWNKGNKKRCRAYVSFFCLISSLTSSVNEVYRSKVDERVEREEQQRRESPIGISLLNNLRYPSQWSTFEWKSTVSTRDGDGYGKKD